MIVYSNTLQADIDTTDVSSEELEAMLKDWDSSEFQEFAAPGVKRAYRWVFAAEFSDTPSSYGEDAHYIESID